MKNIYKMLIDQNIPGLRKYKSDLHDFNGYELETNSISYIKTGSLDSEVGIYVLLNDDNDIYIGESEEIIDRLKMHNRDEKINFTKVILITNDKLNKTELKQIEQELVSRSQKTKFNVMNKNKNYSRDVNSEFDLVLLNAKTSLVISFFIDMGINFNKIKENSKIYENLEDHIYEIKGSNGGEGMMKFEDGVFVLLKGSKISQEANDLLQDGYRLKLLEMIKYLKDFNFILQEDIKHKSPSFLGTLITGRNTAG